MKNWLFLPVIFLALTACEYPVVHSLPEPELEVLSIGFSSAEYKAAEKLIVLTFDQPYSYDGIFGAYNQGVSFKIENYLRVQNISVANTSYYKDRLEIRITEPVSPEKIFFNREKPCYFYKTRHYSSYSYAILEAKAFIGISELSVAVSP